MKPLHFRTAAAFRRWLEAHHATATELWVGFYRKDTGKGGLTYSEALDEALCFGWIDGIRKKLNAVSYTNRFTPRKPRSIWSRINIARVEGLIRAGRMAPAGTRVFQAREPERSGLYSFENRPQRLDPGLEQIFQRSGPAWAQFQAQPPGYRRTAIWWVMSAKQPATRERRLARLIADSARGDRLALLGGGTSGRKSSADTTGSAVPGGSQRPPRGSGSRRRSLTGTIRA